MIAKPPGLWLSPNGTFEWEPVYTGSTSNVSVWAEAKAPAV